MGYLILAVVMVAICVLDMTRVIRLSKKRWFIPYLIVAPHLPLIWYYYWMDELKLDSAKHIVASIFFILASVLFQFYTTLRVHFYVGQKRNNPQFDIMSTGRNLLRSGLCGMYILAAWYVICYLVVPTNPYQRVINLMGDSTKATAAAVLILTFEVIYAIVFVILYVANGALRIFFLLKNVPMWRKIAHLVLLFVPLLNIYIAHVMCELVKDEYLSSQSDEDKEAVEALDEECKTRYPIVLVHGIGFRDLKWLNYWGRIPKELKRHGAKIYYGHQNAWGTIEDNAEAIAKVIDHALEKNHCDKVNVIAHSKGGLDCRYLISSMGYGDRVASLTTINTPHRGSEMITILNKLPERMYRFIARQLDKPFRLLGEKEPDCYSASKQLDPVYCESFNEKNTDDEKVYYQSYMSVMHGAFSDVILTIPYMLMRGRVGKDNDGLVSVESSQWGEFQGVIRGEAKQGISHADMIDLKREDIQGFDVRNMYYKIVCELVKKGY